MTPQDFNSDLEGIDSRRFEAACLMLSSSVYTKIHVQNYLPSDILAILYPPLQDIPRIQRRQGLEPQLLEHPARLVVVRKRPVARVLERDAGRALRRRRQVQQLHALAQRVQRRRPAGDVAVYQREEGGAVVRELRGAEGGEGLPQEDVAPERLLQLVQRVVPDAAERGRGERLGQEIEVALEDAQRLVQLRRDG